MATQNGAVPQERKKRSGFYRALPQVIAVTVKNILLMVFGMTLGFPTILIPKLSGMDPGEPFKLGPEGISWISSINLICVPLGCVISGPITQPLGRKRSMQLVNIPFLAAWLMLYLASDVWMVFFALALTGITGGLLEAPVLTYVAEVTQPHLRGMLSSTSTMAIIIGIVVQFLMGTFLPWRTLALANCFLPALAFLALFFIPESPYWLISKNRLLDARKSIAWLRGWTSLESIEPEFKELYRSIGKTEFTGIDNPSSDNKSQISAELSRESKLRTLKGLTKATFLKPYGLICFIFFLGHFGGITTLQAYAIPIFATLQTPIDKYVTTVMLGSAELVGCIICVALMAFAGKRLLNCISMIGTGICFAITAAYAYSLDVRYLNNLLSNSTNTTNQTIADTPDMENNYTWVPMVCLVGSALLTYICNRSLPWILIGEVYPNDVRSVASGLSGATGYIFGFCANKLFLTMVQTLTLPGTFLLNSAVGFIGCIILHFILPETEGKHLSEITDHYEGKIDIGNKVRRRKQKDRSYDMGNVNHGFSENTAKTNGTDIESKF